ncbi:MAG: hypothetical protein ACE5LU_02375 [Anaerolineae bacterium]
MQQSTGIKMAALFGLLGIVLALVTACGGGVSQADYEALQQQLTAKEQELANLQQQAEAAQAAPSDAIWITIPDAPPRATRTPPPPGFTPPPPPEMPASYTDPLPLFFYVDTVTAGPGESKYNVDASLGCRRSSVFRRGMHIVWRMEVVDTATGSRLSDNEVDRAVLKLPHGEDINFRFSRHGRTDDAPWFWTAAWDAPLDYPLGVIDYTIEVVTKDGKAGTFKELPIEPARLTLIDGEGT